MTNELEIELKDYFRKNSYLYRFFEEKTGLSSAFDVVDDNGLDHHIPLGVVIENMSKTQGQEKKQMEDIIRKIDFRNGDINHFLNHLALGLAQQYNGILSA